jgi:hypothetical protein
MAVARSLIEVMDGSPNRRLEEGANFKSVNQATAINGLLGVAASPVAVPLGFVDSTSQSLEGAKNIITKPIRSFIDLETDYLNDQTFGNLIGKLSPAVGELYQRNGEAYRTTADVATLFVGAGVISAGVRGTTKVGPLINAKTTVGKGLALPTNFVAALPKKGLETLPQTKFGKLLLGDFDKIEKARENLRDYTKAAIDEGFELADLRTNPGVQEAERILRNTALVQNSREALGIELLIHAGMNESDLVSPDGMSVTDHIKWGIVGVGIGAGVGRLQYGSFVRTMNNEAGELIKAQRSSLGIEPVGDLPTRLVSGGSTQNLLKGRLGAKDLTGEAKGNLEELEAKFKAGTMDTIKKLGKTEPFPNAHSFNMNDTQAELANDWVTLRPQDAGGIVSFNSLPTGRILDLNPDDTRELLTSRIKALENSSDGPSPDAVNRLIEIEQELKRQNRRLKELPTARQINNEAPDSTPLPELRAAKKKATADIKDQKDRINKLKAERQKIEFAEHRRTSMSEQDKINLMKATEELETFENTNSYILDVDGTVADFANYKDTVWTTPFIIKNTEGKSGKVFRNPDVAGDQLSSFGEVKLKNSIKIMSNKKITSSYAMFQSAIDDSSKLAKKLIENNNTKGLGGFADELVKSVSKSSNYIARDLQIELLQKFGREEDFAKVKTALENRFKMPIEDKIQELQLESLSKKFDEYTSHVKKSGDQDVTPLDMSRRLNLKMHDSDWDDATALFDMFEGMRQSQTNFRNFKTFGDFKNQLDVFAVSRIHGSGGNIDVPIIGNNHKIKKDSRPLSFVQDNRVNDVHNSVTTAVAAQVFHRAKIEKARRAAEVYAPKIGEKTGFTPTVTRMYDVLDSLEETQLLKEEILKAVGGQERLRAAEGSQSKLAALANSLIPTQRSFQASEVRGMRETSNVADQVYKVQQAATTDIFTPNEIMFNKFRGKKNRVSQDSFLVYLNSRSMGWNVSNKTKSFGKTLLESDAHNKKLLLKTLPKDQVEEITKGDFFEMPDIGQLQKGKYVPVKITKEADEMLSLMRDYNQMVQLDKNPGRHARGFEVWEPNQWDLPPAFASDKEVVFLRKGVAGDIVEAVFDKSLSGAQAKAQKRMGEDKTLHQISRQHAEEFFGDKVNRFMSSEAITKSGLNPKTGNAAVAGMKRWITDSINNTAKTAIYNYFEPEFRYLETMADLNKSKSAAVNNKERHSVFDTLQDTLLNNKSRATGNFAIKAQDTADEWLNKGFTGVMNSANDAFNSLVKSGDMSSSKRLQQYEKELGYNPLTLGLEAAGVGTNRTFDDFSRRVAAYAGFMTLQLQNWAHFTVTLSTLPSVLPAVIKEFAIRDGESLMDWRRRSGSIVDLFSDPTAPSVSAGKWMIESASIGMTKEGRKIIEEGSKRGNMHAPSVELSKHLSQGGSGFKDSKEWKKVSDFLTWPTNWSEKIYRQNSYALGYKLAKQMDPTLSEDSLHSFANNLANKAAGDYRTVEKPEQFHGAIGNQLGLFQTFFTNYWQRVIGNIEKGDKKALAVQAATQASVFGVETVPGYNVFNSMFSSYDGSVSPQDQLASAYGIEMSEALLTGPVWSIPRLWGSEGIALYSPGDTNVQRAPGITSVTRVPVVNMIRKAWGAADEVVTTNAAVDGFMSGRRAMEIIPNATIFRPGRGMIDVINGYTSDRSGHVLDADTREDMFEIITRLAGAKPLVQNRVEKALFRDRVGERKNKKLSDRMGRDFVSQLRANDGELTEAMLIDFVKQYEGALSNPKGLKTKIARLVKKANTDKASATAVELYKSILNQDSSNKFSQKQTRKLMQLIIADPELTYALSQLD